MQSGRVWFTRPLALAVRSGIDYNQRRLWRHLARIERRAQLPTIRMKIELLVNFSEFWSRLSEDIQSAGKSVFVQTFAFEGDSVGKQLSAALLSSPAKDKRILADSFTRVVLSDRFKYSPANLFNSELRAETRATSAMKRELEAGGVKIQFTNPFGPTPRRALSRNHKKVIVIDDRVAYIGGINFSDHNAAWHDMMLRIDDSNVANFLNGDFLATWSGRDQVAHRQFEGLELFTLDGRTNRKAFQRVLDLIDGAEHSIFVESPYITFPFYERLREATHRGPTVKVLTPGQNNWGLFSNYARLEAAWSKIDLRLSPHGMSHLKAMLIDDRYLIAGSSNFDYFSYRLHQEVLAIFTDPHLIADFRNRVMVRDLANARTVECKASVAGKQLLSFQMRVLDAALTILT